MTDRSDASRRPDTRVVGPRHLHAVGGPPDPAPAAAPRPEQDADAVGASTVWLTAQKTPAGQRRGRYVPESTAHPAKMLPAIAAHAIRHYTQPGDLVLDPMCGIGTTLVEALHEGRDAVGVEYEPHWVRIARANLTHAPTLRARGMVGEVWRGDARHLHTVLPDTYRGRVALVVTSPPYGPSTHGQVSAVPGVSVQKYHHRYGSALDRGNLANIGHHRLLAGFTTILAALVPYLPDSCQI